MFKLGITSRWALMAALGWARLIPDRRRDLINDRPSNAAAAYAPLDGAQAYHHIENPTSHTRGAFSAKRISSLSRPVLLLLTQHRPSEARKKPAQ